MTAPNPQGAMASASDAVVKSSDIGPRTVTISRRTCAGCPALEAKGWEFEGENDEIDRGTRATCAAAGKPISSYWDALTATPLWCPAPKYSAALAPPPAVPESVRRDTLCLLMGEAFTYGVWFADPGLGIDGEHEKACAEAIDKALEDFSDEVRTLLATPSGRADTPPDSAATEPAGWKLVPVEPSGAMWQAGRDADAHPGDSYTAVWDAMLAAAPTAPEPAASNEREIVRHLKRGTEYEVLGEAEGQVSAGDYRFVPKGDTSEHGVWARLVGDGTLLTVYRSRETGKLWYRFPDEFRDGRFETVIGPRPVPAEPQAAGDGWQDVEERLPGEQGQDSEEVLIFLNGHCGLTDMECRQGGGWGIRLGFFDAGRQCFRVHGRPEGFVTHWRPLPAPPASPADAEGGR